MLVQQNLPNAASQLEAILQAFPDLLFTVDEGGIILDYKGNTSVSTLFAPADKFVGQAVEDVLPAEFAENLRQGLQQLKQVEGPISFEYTVQQAGSSRWYEARLVKSLPGQVVVVMRDATRHRQAEEKIRAQLKRMASLRAIDTAISPSLDLHLALSVILSQVTADLQVDAADVLLLNSDDVLEFATGVGFRTKSLQATRLQLGQGYGGVVAQRRKSVHIGDLRRGKTGFLVSTKYLEEGFRSYYGVPLVAKGSVRGVLEVFHRSELHPEQEWVEFLEALAGQAAVTIDNALLLRELQRTNFELTLTYDTTIEGWSRALDLRDRDTEGHTQRVTYAAVKLGRRLGLSEAELVHVRRGAMLHDIGKMAIPDSILRKQGPLTPDEWEEIRRHPRYAYELLSPIKYLRQALEIPLYHHERWDGTGYPEKKRGPDIPLAARLFAVIDVFDALTSPRPYRPAWDKTQARAHIIEESGKHFDPEVTNEFIRMLEASHTGDLSIPK